MSATTAKAIGTANTLADFVSGKPGIYRAIPFEVYLRTPLMSQSVLKQARKSMKHLKCALDGQRCVKVTDDMTLGSALHTCFLEPAKALERFALWTGPRRAGKEWEAFKEQNEGKALLTPGMYENLTGMVDALRQNEHVAEWMPRQVDVECSCIGEIEGVPFKGRVDALTEDPIWDLKKVSGTDDRTIINTIHTFGYHIQGACYLHLFKRKRFCLGFVEDKPPYDVRPVQLSPTWLAIGHKEAAALIQRYKLALETDYWPGASEKMDVLEPPEWAAGKVGSSVTFGGESAFDEKE